MSRTSSHVLRSCGLVLAISSSLLGCGALEETNGADEPESAEGAASAPLVIKCPGANSMTAAWTQVVNGQTSSLGSVTTSVFGFPIALPSNELTCQVDARFRSVVLEKIIFLPPNTVPSACGAKATIKGKGQVLSGVPPFDGFTFKSPAYKATPTYDPTSGRCQVDVPFLPTPTLKVKVSQTCKPRDETSWTCPFNTIVVN